MNVLFLSQRVPYPPNRGDKITTWRLVERLGRRHRVRIVAFAHDAADLAAARYLTERGFPTYVFRTHPRWDRLRSLPLLLTRAPLTLGVFGSRALQAAVGHLAAESDLGYAYSSSMGAFLLPHPELARVMHFAELDSDKWRQYAARTRPPRRWIYAREHATLLAYETRLARSFDENIFCTPLEAEIFRARIPGPSSIVLRNGVDLEHFRPAPDAAEPGHLVFVGVMDYYPNVEGCVWFVEEILPKVQDRVPEARLSIVGAHPVPAVRRLARRPGVVVTGYVDDPRDWLRRAAVSVAPLRIARGIQNKVLEAMAMGLPVVGTGAATQGVEGRPGEHYLVADEPGAQAEAIARLLADRGEARRLGERARRFVAERYDWEVTLAPLDALIERLATREGQTGASGRFSAAAR
ncbi:MAG: TIGR03087 family PEP-CTERM/XrtA system glycosyltransferase [Planctomycetota bacterium]